jgi:hypothetical protein
VIIPLIKQKKMDVKLKRIVIMILLFGVFMIWYGNAVAPADDQEFYGLYG